MNARNAEKDQGKRIDTLRFEIEHRRIGETEKTSPK